LIATPATLAPQIDKLKQRFGLEHVVLAGDRGSPKSPADFSGCPDRGMIRPRSGLMCREASAALTGARLSEDVKPAGLDWITALRGPAIKDLLNSGALQLTLFDQRDMASSTAPDDPGERLVVCRNPDLAAERARKREDLLAATGKDLIRIQTAVERKRNPLCGTAGTAFPRPRSTSRPPARRRMARLAQRFRQAKPDARARRDLPVPSFRTLPADLATLARNTIITAINPNYPLTVMTRPTPVQQKAFDLPGLAV
jgi:hypothetical protein